MGRKAMIVGGLYAALAVVVGINVKNCLAPSGYNAELASQAKRADADEKRNIMRSAACSLPDSDPVFDVIRKMDGSVAMVHPEIWERYTIENRQLIAVWAGLCAGKQDSSTIMNGDTGKIEARWDLELGYW